MMTESAALCAMWTCPSCGNTVRSVDRYRYASQGGKLAKHCGCVVRAGQNMTAEEFAAHRRQKSIELKRKYRREAGAVSRAEIAAVAAAKRVALSEARAATQLHDAHVKRCNQVTYDRKKAFEANRVNPDKTRARASKRRQSLNDSYVIQNLKQMGMPVPAITPSLIAMKRESMDYRRLARNTKSTVQQHLEKENETITEHA